MCDIVKGQRRTFRDQDPPRICKGSDDNLKVEQEFSQSTPNSPTILQQAASIEKCFSEPEFHEKDQQNRKKEKGDPAAQESTSSDFVRRSHDSAKAPETNGQPAFQNRTNSEGFLKELSNKVPSSGRQDDEVCLLLFLPLFGLLLFSNICSTSCVHFCTPISYHILLQ